jgi:hypothetical protein
MPVGIQRSLRQFRRQAFGNVNAATHDHSEKSHIALDAAILAGAFEDVLKDLGLVDRNDPAIRLAVANQIITFAKVGVHDPAQLRNFALEAVRIERNRPPPWIPGTD